MLCDHAEASRSITSVCTRHSRRSRARPIVWAGGAGHRQSLRRVDSRRDKSKKPDVDCDSNLEHLDQLAVVIAQKIEGNECRRFLQ
jgi:hypothetical protein